MGSNQRPPRYEQGALPTAPHRPNTGILAWIPSFREASERSCQGPVKISSSLRKSRQSADNHERLDNLHVIEVKTNSKTTFCGLRSILSEWQDSNPRLPASEAGTLPTELHSDSHAGPDRHSYQHFVKLICSLGRNRTYALLIQSQTAITSIAPRNTPSENGYLRKWRELNPHESFSPNDFQGRGHRPLACTSRVSSSGRGES